ncbi:MAG: DUF4382 domain-containing protein, partial [Chloroflexi bacterium]|nr:DUF4382 domain-containing protein [Chloroflexota bacterium]
MENNLEQLLDECIDRIAFRGEAVQDCLARHPQRAAELEPYLRIVTRYAAAFQETPSEAAKELGRQRLKAELDALRAAGANGSPQPGQLTPPPSTLASAASFDEALDHSITRILRGEPVEACLATYPGHAAALAPHLRIAAMTVEAAAVQVDANAKAQGRLRLQAELAALHRVQVSVPARRNPWPSLAVPLQQRWAVASTAAAFALFLGGFGLVSASDDALPGQPLYPVKRTAEEVRLVLDFSPEAKAHRYLSYAERRGQEISLLIQQGEQTKVSDPQAALVKHIASAATIAAELDKPEAVSKLQTRFEQNASQILAELQTSLQTSPEEARQTARESFKSVGQAYSERIQDVAAKAPKVVTSPGILQLRATNPLPPGIEAVLLKVSRIEAHRADWPDDRWIDVATSSQELDLLRLGEVQRFLGELEVPAGVYTQLRIAIQEATVVVGGVAYPVQVPGETLHLTRPFRVEAGKTTVALLDFDGTASLRATGVDNYILNPQVHLLAREPQETQKKGKETDTPNIADSRQTVAPASAPEHPSTPSKPSQRQESKVEVLEVEGDIKKVLDGIFQV